MIQIHPRETHKSYRSYLDSEMYVQKRLKDHEQNVIKVFTVYPDKNETKTPKSI